MPLVRSVDYFSRVATQVVQRRRGSLGTIPDRSTEASTQALMPVTRSTTARRVGRRASIRRTPARSIARVRRPSAAGPGSSTTARRLVTGRSRRLPDAPTWAWKPASRSGAVPRAAFETSETTSRAAARRRPSAALGRCSPMRVARSATTRARGPRTAVRDVHGVPTQRDGREPSGNRPRVYLAGWGPEHRARAR